MTSATSVQACGCIVTRHGGHTHTKLCKECQAVAFKNEPVIYPAIQDVKPTDTAWLEA
jgi:hypothetical protein